MKSNGVNGNIEFISKKFRAQTIDYTIDNLKLSTRKYITILFYFEDKVLGNFPGN